MFMDVLSTCMHTCYENVGALCRSSGQVESDRVESDRLTIFTKIGGSGRIGSSFTNNLFLGIFWLIATDRVDLGQVWLGQGSR